MMVGRCVLNHRNGGMPAVTSVRADALAAAGFDVHVVTTAYGNRAGMIGNSYDKEHRNLTIHYNGDAPAHEWSGPFADACVNWMRRLQPAVVHTDSLDRKRPFWLERGSGVKCVATTLHGFGWGSWLTKWNMARILGNDMPPF